METHLLKKPKLEVESAGDVNGGGGDVNGGTGEDDSSSSRQEQEEALVALIEHRTKECEHLKQRVAYYKSQLLEAERRLNESQTKLGRLRSRSLASTPSTTTVVAAATATRPVKVESESRPQLLIPPLNAKIPPTPAAPTDNPNPISRQVVGTVGIKAGASPGPGTGSAKSSSSSARPPLSQKGSSAQKQPKRKLEHREHRDLIPSIRTCSSPNRIRFQAGTLISSQHKRKLRTLELCPVDDQLFVTSALDGVVHLWQVQAKGSGASLLSTMDCVSPKQRRWPEDVAWHPDGDSIFAAYSADGGDSQISILNLNASREKKVTFLEAKPHLKGIINSIIFMPWIDCCFATGGSDHAVILWHDRDDFWKPKKVHGDLHSSAVMGIAGLQQRKVILSVGADKRIVAFDTSAGRSEFKYQIESKCMSVLPNPSDFNLYMVQTGAPGKQLRLFDVRLRQTEIHAFGWKQESSESQSALINQAWSPDGFYLTSGSADPMIHIFDIRYDGRSPSQSVQAHQKRVFKAVWHQSVPLLTSISSDLNIGLHKMA